jgi:hypothetical protein
MKLSTLRNKSVKCSLPFGEETLSFTHNPARFTPRFYQELLPEDSERKVGDLAVFVNALVSEWDLVPTDDDIEQFKEDEIDVTALQIVAGCPFPLSVDALCVLPVEFLGAVVGAINEANRPNESSSAASSYGS